MPASQVTDSHVFPTVKFGGCNIMVWGCIRGTTVGKIFKIEGRMNADAYIHILKTSLLPSLRIFDTSVPISEEIVFQQDNDQKHKAKKTMNWIIDHGLSLLDWLPQSPDINIIEHIWFYIKQQLTKYPDASKSVHVAAIWTCLERNFWTIFGQFD